MVVKAVEMVREIRDRHYEETRNLPFEKQIEYIKKKSQKLQNEIKSARRKVGR